MGWKMGFEPTVSSATNWRFNQLSYIHHMARQKGLEPLTYCLEGSCSIQLSYWRISNGAGDGNRTRVSSLEGWCSTIELHPRKPLPERFSFDILAWFLLFVKHFLWHIPTKITKPSLRKNGGCPNRAASITFALITLQTPQPWFPG